MNKANLKEIIKLSDNIRQKYLSLKRGVSDTEHVLQETFKPIVTPLETLVKQTQEKNEAKKKKIKQEHYKTIESAGESEEEFKVDVQHGKNKIKQERYNKKESVGESEDEFKADYKVDELKQKQQDRVKFLRSESVAESDTDRSIDEIIEDTLLSQEGVDEIQSYLKDYGSIAKYYMTLYITNDKNVDKSTYGLRYDDGDWYIGNARVTIDKDDLNIGGEWYEGTPGLYELIFMKNPDETKLTENDVKTFREITDKTNVGRINYNPATRYRGSRNVKYKKYIAPKKGGALKKYVKAKPHYVYWDNINELVDRLRLLIASQEAGHTGHDNEILSIMEELREAEILE